MLTVPAALFKCNIVSENYISDRRWRCNLKSIDSCHFFRGHKRWNTIAGEKSRHSIAQQMLDRINSVCASTHACYLHWCIYFVLKIKHRDFMNEWTSQSTHTRSGLNLWVCFAQCLGQVLRHVLAVAEAKLTLKWIHFAQYVVLSSDGNTHVYGIYS